MRFLSIIFLLAALVFLGQALWPILSGGDYSPVPLGQIWSQIEPKSLIGLGKGLEQIGLAAVYDTVFAPVINTALWVLLGILGLVLFAAAWAASARR